MANTGGFFDALGNSLFGGGSTALQQLQNNGYQQYQVTGAPDVSKNFQGYGAKNANTSANSPYMQAQQQLLGQLQGQANGTGGPTMADQQLHAGVGATLAAQKAAMAGSRGQNAGLSAGQLGTEAAGAMAGEAGAAGAQRAQEQQAAQSQLGGLTQGAIGQGNQLGEFNAGQQSEAGQYDSGLQAQLGNLNNQDWQYKNNLGAQQQSQQNALVGQQVNGQVASQNSLANGITGGLFNTAISGGSTLAGMADGGVVIDPQASNGFRSPDPMGLINQDATSTAANKGLAGAIGGSGKKKAQTPAPAASTMPDMIGTGGALGGASDAGGVMGGDVPMADGGLACCNGGIFGHADGCVMAATGDVANGPQKAIIGENGPEAVVPIKPNGDVDPARARNPALQNLLEQHPALRHIQATGQQPGTPSGTGDHATAAALAQAGAHLSDRVAQLEATIGHLARRNQRRAA
jgi:hypothetical protein